MPQPKARPKPRRMRDTLKDDISIKAEDVAMRALFDALKHDPKEIIRPLVDEDKVKEEAERLAGSLRLFIPQAWHLVEPSVFIPNWHIDAIAEHLEAVTNNDIQDLLITMPPRHSKSLIVSVLWPVWEWLTLPSFRWVFTSYAFSLSVRDSVKRRGIISSDWFQERWCDNFTIDTRQDTKVKYMNNKHGFMLASSVGGSNTGEGGERIIADDPHNVKKAESEVIRNDTVEWWNGTMSTRRNDLRRSARIVVQQRTHEGDVAGDIIERGGYVHLNLPTEFGFAGGQRCRTGWTVRATGEQHTWEDPRQEEGELLNPQRFNSSDNEKAKLELGDYQYAAQHGQNPTPPKGQIIQAQWMKFYGGPGQPAIPDFTLSNHPFTPLFSLDCAFKEHKDTDFVAGLCWAMFGADLYLMPICFHKRASFTDTIEAVAEMVGGDNLEKDKHYPGIYPYIKIKLVEDKANGSAIVDTLQHRIPGMMPFEPGAASKVSRLQAVSWRFRAGNVYLPHESIAPWIKEYIYELCAFPKAKKDDYVDATSQALLFIGGDSAVEGTPVMSTQESKWFGLGSGDLMADNGSVWGQFGGRSIWRQ